MRLQTEEYIKLTEDVLHKLAVIKSSIEEEMTKKQLIEGGVDLMYGYALRFLYMGGEITEEGLENGLSYLEDYHAEKVLSEIDKSRENL